MEPLDIMLGDDLSAAGYSAKEISLIGYCWQDSAQINTKKTALALHLYELKQEMDNGDSGAGAGCVKSRFWAAFEAGHLPLQGDSGRSSVHTALQAAAWLAERESSEGLDNSLHTLAPSTIVEISNLGEPAQELVFKAIESSDFIGVAAVRLLAKEKRDEVIDRLFSWVTENPGTAITPRVIGSLTSQFVQENAPPAGQTVDTRTDEEKAEADRKFQEVLRKVREQRPQREQKAKVDAVKEELGRAEREERERVEKRVRDYNSALNDAYRSVHTLLICLQGIDRIDGTQYLDVMRMVDVMGLITVKDDLARIKQIGEELLEAAKLANSSNPPTGIDMSTYTVDVED